ncbi:MAG: SAM-dependent methyltransferase, partial [Candidatus Tectomicrobia bacterium]|nr:SAM-dependent methyltransferase [Candidatus Tectomicrobia bacterium]
MDWSIRGRKFQQERKAALAPAEGDVLEVGFGTGLNLAHYPPSVRTITAADPALMLPRRAR